MKDKIKERPKSSSSLRPQKNIRDQQTNKKPISRGNLFEFFDEEVNNTVYGKQVDSSNLASLNENLLNKPKLSATVNNGKLMIDENALETECSKDFNSRWFFSEDRSYFSNKLNGLKIFEELKIDRSKANNSITQRPNTTQETKRDFKEPPLRKQSIPTIGHLRQNSFSVSKRGELNLHSLVRDSISNTRRSITTQSDLSPENILFLECLKKNILPYAFDKLNFDDSNEKMNKDGNNSEDDNESFHTSRHLSMINIPNNIVSIKNSSIVSLDLSDRSMGVDRGICLSEALKYCPSLSVIKLSNNRLDNRSLTKILEILFKTSEHIKYLDISRNGCGRTAVDLIVKYIQNPDCFLEVLKMNHCDMGDEFSALIANSLLENDSVSQLFMSSNRIGVDDEKWGNVWSDLLTQNKYLVTIDISSNFIKRKLAMYIFQSFSSENSVLEQIDLSHNQISDQDITLNAHHLERNHKLVHLNLSYNQIETKGCMALAFYASQSTCHIHYLNLYGNNMSDIACKFILTMMIKVNKNYLEDLDKSNIGTPNGSANNIDETSHIRSSIYITSHANRFSKYETNIFDPLCMQGTYELDLKDPYNQMITRICLEQVESNPHAVLQEIRIWNELLKTFDYFSLQRIPQYNPNRKKISSLSSTINQFINNIIASPTNEKKSFFPAQGKDESSSKSTTPFTSSPVKTPSTPSGSSSGSIIRETLTIICSQIHIQPSGDLIRFIIKTYLLTLNATNKNKSDEDIGSSDLIQKEYDLIILLLTFVYTYIASSNSQCIVSTHKPNNPDAGQFEASTSHNNNKLKPDSVILQNMTKDQLLQNFDIFSEKFEEIAHFITNKALVTTEELINRFYSEMSFNDIIPPKQAAVPPMAHSSLAQLIKSHKSTNDSYIIDMTPFIQSMLQQIFYTDLNITEDQCGKLLLPGVFLPWEIPKQGIITLELSNPVILYDQRKYFTRELLMQFSYVFDRFHLHTPHNFHQRPNFAASLSLEPNTASRFLPNSSIHSKSYLNDRNNMITMSILSTGSLPVFMYPDNSDGGSEMSPMKQIENQIHQYRSTISFSKVEYKTDFLDFLFDFFFSVNECNHKMYFTNFFYLTCEDAEMILKKMLSAKAMHHREVIERLLFQLRNHIEVSRFIIRNLYLHEIIKLKKRLGYLFDIMVGHVTGHYILDLKLPAHREAGLRLASYNEYEKLKLKMTYPKGINGKTTPLDTSQENNGSCFRNATYNSSFVILTSDWFGSQKMPQIGKLRFDFVSFDRRAKYMPISKRNIAPNVFDSQYLHRQASTQSNPSSHVGQLKTNNSESILSSAVKAPPKDDYLKKELFVDHWMQYVFSENILARSKKYYQKQKKPKNLILFPKSKEFVQKMRQQAYKGRSVSFIDMILSKDQGENGEDQEKNESNKESKDEEEDQDFLDSDDDDDDDSDESDDDNLDDDDDSQIDQPWKKKKNKQVKSREKKRTISTLEKASAHIRNNNIDDPSSAIGRRLNQNPLIKARNRNTNDFGRIRPLDSINAHVHARGAFLLNGQEIFEDPNPGEPTNNHKEHHLHTNDEPKHHPEREYYSNSSHFWQDMYDTSSDRYFKSYREYIVKRANRIYLDHLKEQGNNTFNYSQRESFPDELYKNKKYQEANRVPIHQKLTILVHQKLNSLIDPMENNQQKKSNYHFSSPWLQKKLLKHKNLTKDTSEAVLHCLAFEKHLLVLQACLLYNVYIDCVQVKMILEAFKAQEAPTPVLIKVVCLLWNHITDIENLATSLRSLGNETLIKDCIHRLGILNFCSTVYPEGKYQLDMCVSDHRKMLDAICYTVVHDPSIQVDLSQIQHTILQTSETFDFAKFAQDVLSHPDKLHGYHHGLVQIKVTSSVSHPTSEILQTRKTHPGYFHTLASLDPPLMS